MNWKKFLLIGLAVGAFAFAAAPRAEARISVGIGFGFPFGIGYYDYGYPSSYDYYGCRPRYRNRQVIYVRPRYYRSYGRHHVRRIHHPRRYHHRQWR